MWGYIKQVLIILLLFVASVYCSFLYDAEFRRMVRFLYTFLSGDRIEIIAPKKYIHFANEIVVLSFAFYTVLLYTILREERFRGALLFLSLTLIMFFITVAFSCYIEALALLAECTACLDGKRIIGFNEIPYGRIFVQSLIFSTLPVIVRIISQKRRERGEG